LTSFLRLLFAKSVPCLVKNIRKRKTLSLCWKKGLLVKSSKGIIHIKEIYERLFISILKTYKLLLKIIRI